MEATDYKLISKAIFFPKQGILAFGDLHLGYEHMMREEGFSFPFSQLENSEQELIKIFNELKKEKLEIKKIIILGDLKHYFPFKREEKFEVRDFLEFLAEHFPNKEIILIKGNHEKIELDKRKYEEFYIEDNIAFIHGDKYFPEIFDKKIKIIVMGHIHPAIFIEDKTGIKREKYKCFLAGKWKSKDVIILPSFFSFTEGTDIREENYGQGKSKESFSIISKKELIGFDVYVVGKNEIYNFEKFI
jgi:putative SbcD/Mre11-related phosphoesterase